MDMYMHGYKFDFLLGNKIVIIEITKYEFQKQEIKIYI